MALFSSWRGLRTSEQHKPRVPARPLISSYSGVSRTNQERTRLPPLSCDICVASLSRPESPTGWSTSSLSETFVLSPHFSVVIIEENHSAWRLSFSSTHGSNMSTLIYPVQETPVKCVFLKLVWRKFGVPILTTQHFYLIFFQAPHLNLLNLNLYRWTSWVPDFYLVCVFNPVLQNKY